jgi:large subunit ribosomal protein L24
MKKTKLTRDNIKTNSRRDKDAPKTKLTRADRKLNIKREHDEKKTKLKRGDMVQVISGKEVGRTGRVLRIDRDDMRILVEGLNMQTKHQKPNRANQTGGITRREAPIHISNVMYLYKGTPARLSYEVEVSEVTGKDGKTRNKVTKKRYAKVKGQPKVAIE